MILKSVLVPHNAETTSSLLSVEEHYSIMPAGDRGTTCYVDTKSVLIIIILKIYYNVTEQ